ncbi:hypothetical protein [Arthrobacter sp. ISL-5]|uniref:hypothetical protein n=1 Tax=Arthrobacter sp. ISL-5 TaxID=2819111 RepID=UPI001BE83D9C|nr:hypothetical protein [Arthrobacter sp. ISL-5]MBT2551592.1 hypothetical protein [Arthrobacter sp. ISL-5]
MKLTLAKITAERSLERRWDLSDAEPVLAHPLSRPWNSFRLTCACGGRSATAGGPESCRAHAWPAEQRTHTFDSWQDFDGRYPSSMPQWVRDLAAVVRVDLDTNHASANAGAEDRWS